MSPATHINSCEPTDEGYLGIWQNKCWWRWKLHIKCNNDKGKNKRNGENS